MRVAVLAAVLFAFWLLLSGIYTPFLTLMGLASSIAVAALARRMELIDREGQPVRLGLGAMAYWLWLAREIVKSGGRVALIILHPRLPISPTLARFRPSQHSTVGLVTHANSISLTPGTVTVEAERDGFLVHALTSAAAEGLAGSEMDRRVCRFEGAA